jgi:superfamily I DNA/RNA helicase
MSLSPSYLSPEQKKIIQLPVKAKIFLEGLAGTGKTTVGVERLLYLLSSGIPGNKILVIVPQRTLASPYFDMLQSPSNPAGGTVTVLTISGLARRMIDLFWPIIAEKAGFKSPEDLPTFLTIESAQYFMAYLIRPKIAEGYFASLSIDRNRIYSQILDNLNKAAAVGFQHTEIETRLKSAWIGEPAQTRIYADAQECASIFRDFCLANNLLDYSLQIEIFQEIVWIENFCREFLFNEFDHLVWDNIEEDIPLTGDILTEWLPKVNSGLIIYDQDAGYRQFLAADPISNYAIKDQLDVHFHLSEGYISSPEIESFSNALAYSLNMNEQPEIKPGTENEINNQQNYPPIYHSPVDTHYFPEMLDWVAKEINTLIEKGTPPGKIAVLAPYLSDSLRYSLVTRLNLYGIPSRSHRPSRALREEPSAQCLLTLAVMAHPQWGIKPQKADLAYALLQAIQDLDIIRAQLLVENTYKNGELSSFENIHPGLQERITFAFGERFELIRTWLAAYQNEIQIELDHFLRRLFGEVLSQAGFGFHSNYNAAAVAANLIESARKFRFSVADIFVIDGILPGSEYIQMVKDGVIAAQYLTSWSKQPEDAVYLAPAYTFLMSNRPVDVQFWLDIGSRGWYERLYQPLTHPHVLSRHWKVGYPWTDADEFAANKVALHRLILGLTRRCRNAIYLGFSEVNEQGYEHKGELLRWIDKTLLSFD